MTKSIKCLISAVLLTSFAQAESFNALGIKRIKIENGQGSIKVMKSDSNRIQINKVKRKFEKSCEIFQKVANKTIQIKVEDSSFTGMATCHVEWTIMIPKLLDIKLAQGQGDIIFDTNVKSANIQLGAGKINFRADTKKLAVNIGAGNSYFDLKKVERNSKYKIQSGTGDVFFNVPKNTRVKAKLKTPFGKLNSEIENSKRANLYIDMSTGKGNLNIKKI